MINGFAVTRWLPLLLALYAGSMDAEAASCWNLLNKSRGWYTSKEALYAASNVVSWQAVIGSWPKNLDTSSRPFSGDPANLKGIFDNGATTGELRFLGRVIEVSGGQVFKESFFKGVDLLLKAQYPNGGWPQTYPPPKSGYARHITFNDGTMVRIIELMRDISRDEAFNFVDQERRTAASKAFDKGIDCILNCQIRINDRLTVWCAQHDEKDLKPRPARSYELISLSGSESVGIVHLLMSIDNPNLQIQQAVESAVSWFQTSKINGFRVEQQPDKNAPKGKNKVVISDPNAPALWARFYEIETMRPFFCDRDGIKKYSIAEIGYERRNGYSWYGEWPKKLLGNEYPEWKKKWSVKIP